jgi:hypothetical protein
MCLVNLKEKLRERNITCIYGTTKNMRWNVRGPDVVFDRFTEVFGNGKTPVVLVLD